MVDKVKHVHFVVRARGTKCINAAAVKQQALTLPLHLLHKKKCSVYINALISEVQRPSMKKNGADTVNRVAENPIHFPWYNLASRFHYNEEEKSTRRCHQNNINIKRQI